MLSLAWCPIAWDWVLTGSFNPADVSGDSSALTLNAAATLAPGVYTVLVHGLVPGVLDESFLPNYEGGGVGA